MGRRPGVSDTERAFRAHFAAALKKAISVDRGAASAAAKRLGVSRQALSLYLKAKVTPSAEVIRRACTAFKLTMTVRGQLISHATYQEPRTGPESVPPLQLPLLPDAIRALGDDQLQVEVLNKIGDSVELRVRIDFAKKAS